MLARVAAPPDAVVRYAAHGDGVIDLHLPDERGPHPLVVTLHGGFWKQEFDRRHLRPLARALVADGCVVAAPEYRRVGGAGGWPMTGDDVLAAFTALPALLDGLGVATSSVTVLGHSAGGQLALWLAAQGGGIDRVVALAPVADLVAAARDGLGGGATQALLGGLPSAVPEAYADADPLGLLGFAAPATRITVAARPDRRRRRPSTRRGRWRDGIHGSTWTSSRAGTSRSSTPCSAQWPSVRAAVLGDVA